MSSNDPRSLATANRRGLQPEPKRLDLFAALRKHLLLSFVLMIVVAAPGAWFMIDRDALMYISYSEVGVSRNFQRTLQNDREMEMRTTQEYDIFRNEQIGLMLRADVLEEGLRRAGQLDNGTWAAPEDGPAAAVGAFGASLDVYGLTNTLRFAADLRGYNPYVLEDALNGLLEAFLDAHRQEFFFGEDERPEILRKTLEEIDAVIAGKRAELKALAEELNVLDFKENRTNPWLTPLENARLALVETQREQKNLQIELDNEGEPEIGEGDLEMVLLGGAQELSEGLSQLVGPLVERRTAALSRLLDMGPGHPARAELERQVTSLEGQIADLLQRHAVASRSSREAELTRLGTTILQLEDEVKDLEGRAKNFVSAFQEGMVIEDSLVDDTERRAAIKGRLSFFELETQSPSYVRIVAPASQVDLRGESNLVRNLGVVAILALLVAFGIPILLELRDDKIHTTQDVQDVLGFPPAIWVPIRKKESQKLLAADQIRRFALALDRDQAYARSRLVLFSEVKESQGTLEIIEEIATALAGFGRKVLVVDATAPRVPRPAAEYQTPGFLGLLGGQGLQVLSRNGWDFLEYGNPLLEQSHSLSGWNGILRAAAQDYDLVLLKTGPLLVSPDAEHMASSADLVVLVVEAETQTRGEVQRAGDVLAAIQPASVGSILINAKVFHGHGYYSELVKERKALPASAS